MGAIQARSRDGLQGRASYAVGVWVMGFPGYLQPTPITRCVYSFGGASQMGRKHTNSYLWAITVMNRVDDTALLVPHYSIPYLSTELSAEVGPFAAKVRARLNPIFTWQRTHTRDGREEWVRRKCYM